MQDTQLGSGLPARQLPDRLLAVGPGWHPLLLQLHEQLLVIDPGYRIDDMKEKLGTVRIRVASASTAAHHAMSRPVVEAEVQSATICEFCGASGRRRRRNEATSGWIKAVCNSCHDAWSHHMILIINGEVRHRRSGSI